MCVSECVCVCVCVSVCVFVCFAIDHLAMKFMDVHNKIYIMKSMAVQNIISIDGAYT